MTTNCPTCNGEGKVKVYDNSAGVNPLRIKCWQMWRCQDCNGTGKK